MVKRHPNHRRVKIHRSYTVEEIASLLFSHKNTVREWIRCGLPTIDSGRPKMVQGRELITFLQARRERKRRHCQADQMYCVRCHAPKCPAVGMVDYLPITEKVGNLRGLCPDCCSIMHRCVSLAKIGQIQGKIDITFPQALRHLRETSQPTVNSDLK
jgi:hypothetical protein